MTQQPISRRTLFRYAGLAGAVAAGYSALGTGRAAADSITDSLGSLGSVDPGSVAGSEDVWKFVTRPDLSPGRLTVTGQADGDSGSGSDYVLCAPRNFLGQPVVGQEGLLIVDQHGDPVWFRPLENPFDLQVATYRGETVLLWWNGPIDHGHGEGTVTIADTAYNTISEVHAVGGVGVDLHEALITDDDTLLVTVYAPVRADLRPVGGPANGWVYEGRIQEIDIATGELTMQWNSLDHVPVGESTLDLGGAGASEDPFDYFHINSIQTADGGLIVSARHTDAVYKLSRDGKRVLWRLGGKKSDFALAADAGFARQHDARLHPDGTLSLFDNEDDAADGGVSSALLLDVDWTGRSARVRKRLFHTERLWANSQGNTQVLADGAVFVGWGAARRMSRFAADGTMVWDAAFPGGDHTYRGFLQQWTGRPADVPAAKAVPVFGGVDVYASWNGATEVRTWRLLAGGAPDALRVVTDVPRTGFETKAHSAKREIWYAMAALDATGKELGRSAPVRPSGSSL